MTVRKKQNADTIEMIRIINAQADAAYEANQRAALRMAAIKAKETQNRRDEELTKCVLYFSFGLLIGTACISTALWLMGIHPMQAVVP